MDLPTALLTIIGSGVVAAGVTYLLNSNKEQIFFMRKKAEDLYMNADQFQKIYGTSVFKAFPLFKGQIDYNTYLDDVIKDGEKADKADTQSSQHMNMLTRIYFPQLTPLLKEWERQRSAVNKVISDHKRAYKRGETDPEEDVARLQAAIFVEIKAAEAFQEGIVIEGQKFASSDALWPEGIRRMRDRSHSLSRDALDRMRKLRKG